MPALEGMHAPGSEIAHVLPPAGERNADGDVYRFNRVIPFYPPDPCIRPNEADLVCQEEDFRPKNHPHMRPAGVSTLPPGDRFAFYKARAESSKMPCASGRSQRQVEQPCPCTNSSGYSPRMRNGNVDLRYGGSLANTTCGPQVAERAESYMNGSCSQSNYDRPMLHAQSSSAQFSNTPFQPEHANQQLQSEQYVNTGNMYAQNNLLPGYNTAWRNQLPQRSANPYCSHPYVCRPVYHRKYLEDCPQQDGPPADSYTFL